MRSRLANPPRIFLRAARHRPDQVERGHRRAARTVGGLVRVRRAACRRSTACRSPVSAMPATATSTPTSWWITTQPGAQKRAEACARRTFRAGSSPGAAPSPANTASAWPKSAGGRWRFPRSARTASHRETRARPARHLESGQVCLNVHAPFTRTTNSPFKLRFCAISSNAAGLPRRNSSNFLVSSRASTTSRSGKTSFNSPSSFSMRYGDS